MKDAVTDNPSALINIMVLPLVMFPILIGFFVQGAVAVSRLNKFLLSEEIDANAVQPNPFGKESIAVEGTFDFVPFDFLSSSRFFK